MVPSLSLTHSRPRPQTAPPAVQGARRTSTAPGVPSSSNQRPLVGGTITFSLAEAITPMSEAERVLREVATCGAEPVDRTVRLELGIKWEVGEAGAGGGLKGGEAMDASGLKIVSVEVPKQRTNALRIHHP